MSIRFYSEAGARPSKEENLANLSTHCMIVPSKKGKQNRNQMFPRFTEHYYLRGIVPSSNGWFYAHTRSLSEVVHSTSVFRKIRVCIVWGHPPVWDKDHIYTHLQHTIAIPCSTHLEKKTVVIPYTHSWHTNTNTSVIPIDFGGDNTIVTPI
jgi:thioester reductase-like protein